jgi:hypothetical protein|tara:strand:+ start:1302 stop:1661 length:360 start_codon:yes stop_codon:yes gene_type:complete
MSAFNLNQVAFTATIMDVSTAGSVYIPIPEGFAGRVVEIRTVLAGAIGTADAVVTPSIGGVNMTNGAVTVAFTSSAAGDADVSRPTGANEVAAGGVVKITTSGASTNTVALAVTVVITR